MRRGLAVACALLMLMGWPCRAVAQSDDSSPETRPLDDDQLLHKYVWTTLGPAGALHATIVSGIEAWRDAPIAWGRDRHGYAERWASEYAATAIGGTTKYAVAHLLHQDPSFVRCACDGVAPRVRHALSAPFHARTPEGRWVLSPATVAGLAAQNVVPAATWYPAPRGVRDGTIHALSAVASKIAVDVVREFVPTRWLRKPI